MERSWEANKNADDELLGDAVREAVVSFRFDALGADGAPVRLGIMGGTFDPIHMGHLACAEMARDACGLDAVVFMVAANPSLKQQRTLASVAERFAMCALAIADDPRFDLSALEARRGGITYTSDTMRIVRDHYPDNVELSFIIGADSLATLRQWHDADLLKRMVRFICVSRPGAFDEPELLRACRDEGFRLDHVSAPLLDISSSEIRQRVGEGRTIRYLVPRAVSDYIEEKGLYGITG